MARDPNERIGPGEWLEKPDDLKVKGITPPTGYVVGTGAGQYYAHFQVHADGHTTVEWYKRGAGGGGENPDPVETTTAGPPVADRKADWDKEEAKPAPTVSIGGVPNVVVGQDPTTGQDIYGPVQTTTGPAGAATSQTATQQNEAILNQQRAKNAALPPGQDPRYETDQERAARADATIKAQGAEAKAAAEANKPQLLPSTVNTTSPRQGVWNPATQTVDWTANPNYQNPNPQPINIPGNPRTILWDDGPGKPIRTEKNPGYIKPSKIMPHPSDPNRMVNVTEDDNGNPVILPVDDKTVIKPADLPVLQAKYGQIAQGLGALAQDLNSRYARGEITEQQKNDAFTAAHQQAQTQVSEINQILDTSKAIWSGELQQRGQSLGETQSRRGFASDIFNRSFATGLAVGESAGPGHGKAIAAGVGAMMRMGQRYAEGMGGFRESPEVPLPAALQQARGIGLPGFESPFPGGGSGISDTTDRGAVPRVRTPSSSGPLPPAPGPAPQAMAPGMSGSPAMGQDPRLAAMQQQLMGGQGFGGSPVAAGGLGVYDPTQDVQGMVGDGADPTWAEAVKRAAGELSQPGYAWQRFTQPASRYG